MAHAQKHNLECLDGVALIRICNFCFGDTGNIKVEIKFI